MNKTSLTALAVGVVALVAAGFAVLKPAEVKLGSYTNGGVINGNTFVNYLVQGILGFANNGLSPVINTTTTLTAAQFCAVTNEEIVNTTGTVTVTLPSATSSYLACTGGFGAFGAWNQNLITNISTNTAIIAAGPGMTFKCETQGVGTTTVIGGCTQSQVSIPASTTAQATGYWDTASSSMKVMWGNMWY